jgi:uncharacterized hydrophobic protein (TIGR00341 family)
VSETQTAAESRRLVRLGGGRRTLPELRDELFLDVGDVAAKQSRFWILLVLSAVIATAGVWTNSTATVIGAMIVAPLGTPIMAVGLGVVVGEPKRILYSLLTVAGAIVVVVLLAAFLAWILPQSVPIARNGQITSRTSPGLVDLLAAIAVGFAGAFGLARKDISDVMPGVAIAISLVPPLTVVGITAQAGDWNDAWGAFLLFASNMVAMVLAGAILFTAYGYLAEAQSAPGFRRRRAYAVIGAATALILAPLAVTTIRIAEVETWRSHAAEVARQWAEPTGYRVIAVDFRGDDLVVVIEGQGSNPPVDELSPMLEGQVPAGTPVIVNTVTGGELDAGSVPG